MDGFTNECATWCNKDEDVDLDEGEYEDEILDEENLWMRRMRRVRMRQDFIRGIAVPPIQVK